MFATAARDKTVSELQFCGGTSALLEIQVRIWKPAANVDDKWSCVATLKTEEAATAVAVSHSDIKER